MTTQGLLNQLASKGRYGDTELAHINPQEAQILKSLGGSETVNPETGLKEYWSLRDQLFGSGSASGENPIFGKTPIQDQVTDFTGDLWDNTIGNAGIFNWASDRLGFGFNPNDGFYAGSHPGDDNAWNSAAAGLGPMRESIGEMELLIQQIKDSYETGTDIFNKGTEVYNQGTDAYFKDKGLLGQISREKLPSELRAYENFLGRSGSKFGVSGGPVDPRNASGNAYNRSVFDSRNAERSRRGGEISRQGNEALRQQSHLDSLWGVIADARNRYGDWWGGILSPEYQAQAPTFEEVTAGMDWLTPPSGTTWQPNYPTTVPQ
jgi:hypothetical protein